MFRVPLLAMVDVSPRPLGATMNTTDSINKSGSCNDNFSA